MILSRQDQPRVARVMIVSSAPERRVRIGLQVRPQHADYAAIRRAVATQVAKVVQPVEAELTFHVRHDVAQGQPSERPRAHEGETWAGCWS